MTVLLVSNAWKFSWRITRRQWFETSSLENNRFVHLQSNPATSLGSNIPASHIAKVLLNNTHRHTLSHTYSTGTSTGIRPLNDWQTFDNCSTGFFFFSWVKKSLINELWYKSHIWTTSITFLKWIQYIEVELFELLLQWPAISALVSVESASREIGLLLLLAFLAINTLNGRWFLLFIPRF